MARLVWSSSHVPPPGQRCSHCGRDTWQDLCGTNRHKGRYTDQEHLALTGERILYRYGPLIGPRLRLPQAKDVPEAVVMQLLGSVRGVWWTAWRGLPDGPAGPTRYSLPDAAPELAAFPWKVLNAKLASMRRRQLIDGCPCGCRGDWRL